MRKTLTKLAMTLLLTLCACSQSEKKKIFFLQGAWILQQKEYPGGKIVNFTKDGNGTGCLLYGSDSTLYVCDIMDTPSGLVITPMGKTITTLVSKGSGDFIYLENDNPRPLVRKNDTTITIQRNSIVYSYVRDNNIYRDWDSDIRNIISSEADKVNTEAPNHFVLSAKERAQGKIITWLGYLSAFIVAVAGIAIHLAATNRKAKRQLQLQLQQIQEVKENRPQMVRQAFETVENDFFASDEYTALQKTIASGNILKEEEWQQIEQQLKTLYPGFTTQLRSLHPMSELEYRTCLLIKLRIAAKDIAAVLAREASTISTVRSRLYKKVFGTKGGAKDWDDFILSIGR